VVDLAHGGDALRRFGLAVELDEDGSEDDDRLAQPVRRHRRGAIDEHI